MSDDREDAEKLLELEREQWRRECRRSFTAFCVEVLSSRGETPARHHRLICQALQDVAEGRCKRLMILAPPGSAKTTYTSRLFPAWYFAFRPRSSIIACSHTQGLSELNSGFVQRFIRENTEIAGYNLIKDPSDSSSAATTGSVSKERWYTDNHCAFRAGSVGSAILGFRCNLGIIDDPIASRAEAESETYRESTWQWFVNDLTTRLTPDGAIILIMTLSTRMTSLDVCNACKRTNGASSACPRSPTSRTTRSAAGSVNHFGPMTSTAMANACWSLNKRRSAKDVHATGMPSTRVARVRRKGPCSSRRRCRFSPSCRTRE
jgi:hypothetical protein